MGFFCFACLSVNLVDAKILFVGELHINSIVFSLKVNYLLKVKVGVCEYLCSLILGLFCEF